MDELPRDFLQAIRFLRRRPLFTATAILTLALGIGASTALFSVVRGVLLVLQLLNSLAAVAAALAALGIYGVLAYTVRQSRREIGVRMALGAGPRRNLARILSSALRLTGVGVAIGFVLSQVLAPKMAGLIYGVGLRDAVTSITVIVLTLLAALVAASLPARQASRTDPIVALRSE